MQKGRNDKRRYQRNCTFSNKKEKGQHGIREKIKQKTSLADCGKNSLERLEDVKSIFYSENDDKNFASSEDNENDLKESSSEEDKTVTVIRRSNPLRIAVVSHFSCFFLLYLRFSNAYFRL